MIRAVAELRYLSAISRKGLALQLFKVDIFCLVYIHEVETLGVRRTFAVLRNDLPNRPGIK